MHRACIIGYTTTALSKICALFNILHANTVLSHNPHTEAEDVFLIGLVQLGKFLADLILGDVGAARVDDINDLIIHQNTQEKGQYPLLTRSGIRKNWTQ